MRMENVIQLLANSLEELNGIFLINNHEDFKITIMVSWHASDWIQSAE